MSKAVTITVLTADQAARVDRANAYHESCAKTFEAHIIYAFLAGGEIKALKEPLDHGQWTEFRAAHFPKIAPRTATEYAAFHTAFHTKSAPGADLPTAGSIKLLSNGEVPEKERDQILAVARQFDGKTFTGLCRALGIRDKKPQTHTPAKPLTAEETLEAKLTMLRAIAANFTTAATSLADLDDADKALLPRDDWDAVKNAAIHIAKLARTMLRNSKGRARHSVRAARQTKSK